MFLRWLLFLCPASFRNEYGSEMQAVYRKRLSESAVWIHPWIWLEAIADVVMAAVASHWELLWQDLRYLSRTMRRAPGYAAVVVAVAAMGIAAATAVFTIADHVLLRPLPFKDPNQLVQLWEDHSKGGYGRTEASPANYRDWKRMTSSYERMGAWTETSVNMTGMGDPQHIDVSQVTHEVFGLLGVPPLAGRTFTEAEDREGAAPTLVLSYRFWQNHFGGDPNVIGRKVQLNGDAAIVIGVMPAEFLYPNRLIDAWLPARLNADSFADRGNLFLRVIARLKPGVTLEQANAEARITGNALAQQYPETNKDKTVSVNLMQDDVPLRSRSILTILGSAAVFLLLIACANLANLLLARTASRGRELSVRTALGAGRERLMRQLLTESTVFALAGGIAGAALAAIAVPLLSRLVPSNLPIAAAPSADWRMLLFAMFVTSITGIAFGALPALRASNAATGIRSSLSLRKDRIRRVLVIVQVAASLALAISTGLLARALLRVQDVTPGFSTANRFAMRVNLPFPAYLETAKRERLYAEILRQVRSMPGVESAAAISFRPMGLFRGGIWPIKMPGETRDTRACARFVTPGYFQTMNIALRGRDFNASDRQGGDMVAIVSESFVKDHWPGQEAIGKSFGIPFGNLKFRVIGVAGDVKFRGLDRESEAQFYMASSQMLDQSFVYFVPKDIVIRTAQADALQALMPAIRQVVAQADPLIPISQVQTLQDLVESETATRRTQLSVISAFAISALLLAAVGIHGLLSFAVTQRTSEIGLRRALGATTGQIASMVISEAMILGLLGSVAGIAIAFAVNRGMSAFLFGVSPADSVTMFAALGVAFAMTLLGSALPAVRALRIDPAQALRSE